MIQQGMLAPGLPFVDLASGALTQQAYLFMQSLWQRTGEAKGVNAATVVQNITNVTDDLGAVNDLITLALTSGAAPGTGDAVATLQGLQQSIDDLSLLVATLDLPPVPVCDPFLSDVLT